VGGTAGSDFEHDAFGDIGTTPAENIGDFHSSPHKSGADISTRTV
jgi:hypothetical protein